MPKNSRSKTPSPDGRRADPAINNYAQWRVEQWLKENPDKLATNLAEDFGLSDYSVSTLRNKAEGVGWGMARQLARAFNLTLAEFVAEADKYWDEQRTQHVRGIEPLRARTEWQAAVSEAVAKYGVNAADTEDVGRWRAQITGKLTGKTLAALVAAAKGMTNPTRTPRRR